MNLATAEPLKETIENVRLSSLPLSVSYQPPNVEVSGGADIVFFETPNGGAVFSTGSITWFSATLENEFENDVARISRNVIEHFVDSAPFEIAGRTGADRDERGARRDRSSTRKAP